MTYHIIWRPTAVDGLRRLRAQDAQAVKPVLAAVRSLAQDPEPAGSSPLGNAGLRRLRLGDYRVLYEVAHQEITVYVLRVGRSPGSDSKPVI